MMIDVTPPGRLAWRAKTYRCAIGRGGAAVVKREGDGITPAGQFPLRRLLFRADRLGPPATGLPSAALGPSDGWCDEPGNADYNCPVTLPHPASAESLWRDDGIYDVIVVLGHNDDPVVPGAGSAIFLHAATPEYAPTAGCIAVALDDLLEILVDCDSATRLRVSPG